MKKFFSTLIVLNLLGTIAHSDVMEKQGGAMSWDIGYGIVVNKGSSLERKIKIINDQWLPLKIEDFDVNVRLEERNWVYQIKYTLESSQDVSAYELRFIPFNIWGEKDRPLSATKITDVEAGVLTDYGKWRILSENDATEHFAMIGYVAQVKLTNGNIIRANPDLIVSEARKLSSGFSEGDLADED